MRQNLVTTPAGEPAPDLAELAEDFHVPVEKIESTENADGSTTYAYAGDDITPPSE